MGVWWTCNKSCSQGPSCMPGLSFVHYLVCEKEVEVDGNVVWLEVHIYQTISNFLDKEKGLLLDC